MANYKLYPILDESKVVKKLISRKLKGVAVSIHELEKNGFIQVIETSDITGRHIGRHYRYETTNIKIYKNRKGFYLEGHTKTKFEDMEDVMNLVRILNGGKL